MIRWPDFLAGLPIHPIPPNQPVVFCQVAEDKHFLMFIWCNEKEEKIFD